METSIPVAQRELLERLIDLTDEQEHALNTGDLVGLSELSELRSRTVKDAAAYLPPYTAWEPDVSELVAVMQQSTARLQQNTRACMAAVRRELVQLTEGQHVTDYLARPLTGRGESWIG